MSAQNRRLWKVLLANALLWSAAIGWQFQEPTPVASRTPTERAAKIKRVVPPAVPALSQAEGSRVEPVQKIEVPEVIVEVPSLAANVSLSVPFTSQAPYEDWSAPYQEACEEAALLMIDAYLHGTTLPAAIADKRILDLTAAVAQAGYGESVTIIQLASLVEDFFGYQARILEDVTIKTIKSELRDGNPVIVPAAGKELQNPYFSGGGPWYHMLVITGFDEDEFITNDPGTVLGHGFRYQQDHLLSAIHDWTGQEQTISEGKKVMLILEPALSY